MPLIKMTASGVLAVMATGCGGGGGGGGTAAPTIAQPKALMLYLPNTGTGEPVMPTGASTITFAQSSSASPGAGATQNVTVTGGLSNGQTSTSTGAISNSCTADLCLEQGPNGALFSSKIAGKDTLAYSSYGMVATNGTNGSMVGGYHTGTPTAANQLPTNVTATYTGSYLGEAISPSQSHTQVGNASLTANFGAGTVSGNVTSLTNVGTGASAGYGLSMNGTISGGSYTGTAGFTSAANPNVAAGSVSSSALNGGFYGPNAAETAGALAIKGSTPSTGATYVTGGFGGKR
jgi:hypothetical protein